MSLTELDRSVGKGGVNRFDDVVLVQFLVNKHILFGGLQGQSDIILPGTSITKSDNDRTVQAIKAFQKHIVGSSKPDGRVDPKGKTLRKLRESSKSQSDIDAIIMMAKNGLAKGPPSTSIPVDLWQKTMLKLIQFADEQLLTRANIVTMVDFRMSRELNRLWVVDLHGPSAVMNVRVAHGSGSGGDTATSFSNKYKSNMSSVGSYVTMHAYTSTLGSLEKLGLPEEHTGMVVKGLNKKTNSNAKGRGLRFHAAWYIGPNKLLNGVRNSHGCFATKVDVNQPLIDKIKGGSFLFAYAGEKHME